MFTSSLVARVAGSWTRGSERNNMGKTQQQQLLDESALLNIPSYYTTTNDSTTPASARRFKRVCVFCGSSSGNGTVFSNVALDLGRELV